MNSDKEPVHDQLPSVEEYKSSMAPGANTIDPKRIMESVVGTDLEEDHIEPNGAEQTLHNPTVVNDDEIVHDQLPSVEEIHAQRATNTKDNGFCRRCGYCWLTIFFLLVVILPPVILSIEDRYAKRKAEIREYLLEKEAAILKDLDTVTTPQARAVEFLALESYENGQLSEERFLERYALVVLYHATGGSEWKFRMKFLEHTDVCTWNSYFRNTRTQEITQEGVLCEDDDTGRVTLLDVPANNLVGTIPTEIQFLAGSLEKIHMEFNPGLTGDLPFAFSRLTNLWSLELQYNSLTGKLPEWLGVDLPLKRLGLSNNLFTGTIPQTLLDRQTLQILALDDNGLEANIQDFGNFRKMQYLYMEDNDVSGSLTEDLIDSWEFMVELDISTNALNGELPPNLFQSMTRLEILDLHGNELSGPLPEDMSAANRVVFMALHDNKLTGPIPQNISAMISLEHLDLSRNEFSGTIPSDLGLLIFLKYLFIGSNNYNPQNIPEPLMNITTLRELSMKKSNLQGPIPTSIGNLTNLQLLDLDQNSLQGNIPVELGQNLKGLDHLMLNRNQLTGSIPVSFNLLTDLDLLLLDHNQLTGSAESLCDSVSLQYFVTDCDAVPSSQPGMFEGIEVVCPCCNVCCNDQNQTCNMYDWNVNLDPIWEYGYTRYVYTFSNNLVPEDAPN